MPAPQPAGKVQDRLSPLGPEAGNDARYRIDTLEESRRVEEEDNGGHPCFGPRIAIEVFPKGFALPRDTPKYDGTSKPEDWLSDFGSSVIGPSFSSSVVLETSFSSDSMSLASSLVVSSLVENRALVAGPEGLWSRL